jgi:hypothetical protein
MPELLGGQGEKKARRGLQPGVARARGRRIWLKALVALRARFTVVVRVGQSSASRICRATSSQPTCARVGSASAPGVAEQGRGDVGSAGSITASPALEMTFTRSARQPRSREASDFSDSEGTSRRS